MLGKQSLLLENKKLLLPRVKLWSERRLVKSQFIFYQRKFLIVRIPLPSSAKQEREI